jgi:hypothetical protein
MTVLKTVAAAALVLGAQAVQAQSIPATGTLVIVPANGEVRAPNDQAVTHFALEEQDKDKSAAASRVNQKMKQGLEILKREDPNAKLKTQGYYTYPVYPEDRPQPMGVAPNAASTCCPTPSPRPRCSAASIIAIVMAMNQRPAGRLRPRRAAWAPSPPQRCSSPWCSTAWMAAWRA